jgi:hypothetical protein
VAARAVDTFFCVACASAFCRLWPRGSTWLSGASPDSCQGRALCAREVGRQLRPGDHGDQHGDHQQALHDEHERCRAVGQRRSVALAEDVEDDQHDGLDRDAAEDVADRDTDVATGRGGDGDDELGQVRGHREQDHATECGTQVQPRGQDVGLVRQGDPRDPHGGGRRHEDQRVHPERQVRHGLSATPATPGRNPCVTSPGA